LKTLYPLRPKIATVSDFFVFDTETGKQEILPNGDLEITWQLEATQKKFVFGVIYGKNFTKVIHSLKEMQDEFKEKRYKGKKVFAHNLGRYDGSVVYGNVWQLDPEAIYIGSRLISFTNGNCTFADSLNIYKASVKEIGRKMGIHKLGMDDGKYQKSLWPRDKAKDINGCVRDCEIIWDALHEIFNEAGDIKITIGSLAMSYYRRFAQEMYIQSNENSKYFWSSYYGGRTEMFKQGKTNAKVIDVNSLYPYCMKIDFPNPKFLKYEVNIDLKHFLQKILPHYEGCCEVGVSHPVLFIGLLPYRHNGKLCFPCGNFSGIYNFNELRFALKNGVKITSIKWTCYAEKMMSPFIKFVDDLSLKKFHANAEGRELDEWKYKYLLNNLYGKFGQRIDEKTIYLYDFIDQYDLIQKHQHEKTFIKLLPFSNDRIDAFLIVKEKKKIKISYSFPVFPSYITSAGRIILAEKIISMQKNEPLYCDTDSVFYSIDDGTIISSNYLGDWKIENKIITEIRNLKDYSYIKGGKEFSRTKGVPSRSIKIGKNKYEFESLVGTKEGLRRNLEIGTPLKRSKVISGKYNKRVLETNGETKPVVI
jgi:hypothetical protein